MWLLTFSAVRRAAARGPTSTSRFGVAPRAPHLSNEQPYVYEAELTGALGKPVELVELNKAPADLVHEMLREGTLLLDREPDLRIGFEVRARQSYLICDPSCGSGSVVRQAIPELELTGAHAPAFDAHAFEREQAALHRHAA